MAFSVRSILGKVRLHRPDLKESELDYMCQEIVRKVCRQTMLGRYVVEKAYTSYADTIDSSDFNTSSKSVMRITSEEYKEGQGEYQALTEENHVEIINSGYNIENGTPDTWAFDVASSKLYLYPRPRTRTFTVRVGYAYIPQGDIDTIELPQEAEDAIVYGTIAEALAVAGPAANLATSKNYEIKYNYEVSNLKSVGEFGGSGRLTVTPRPIGGRTKRRNDWGI